MILTDLVSRGWVSPHRTTPQELRDKFALIDRNIRNAQVPGLDPDVVMNLSHNAHLQCAIAALYAEGFEASKEHQHYRAIQSFRFTLNLRAEDIALLDTFRRMRNNADYDRAGEVSERDADDALEWAKKLRKMLLEFLRDRHPEFSITE